MPSLGGGSLLTTASFTAGQGNQSFPITALGSPTEVKQQFGHDGSLEDIFVELQEKDE